MINFIHSKQAVEMGNDDNDVQVECVGIQESEDYLCMFILFRFYFFIQSSVQYYTDYLIRIWHLVRNKFINLKLFIEIKSEWELNVEKCSV